MNGEHISQAPSPYGPFLTVVNAARRVALLRVTSELLNCARQTSLIVSGIHAKEDHKVRLKLNQHWLVLICLSISLLNACSSRYDQNRAQLELIRHDYVALTEATYVLLGETTEDFKDPAGAGCYFTRLHLVFGTQLPEAEAVEAINTLLRDSGWHSTEWKNAYGEHAAISTRGWREDFVPVGILVDMTDRANYPSIIAVTLEYVQPSRTNCL